MTRKRISRTETTPRIATTALAGVEALPMAFARRNAATASVATIANKENDRNEVQRFPSTAAHAEKPKRIVGTLGSEPIEEHEGEKQNR